MPTLTCILAIGSFICAVLEALGKCPSWVPQVLLSVALLLTCWPR
jgi:hypothetical protein